VTTVCHRGGGGTHTLTGADKKTCQAWAKWTKKGKSDSEWLVICSEINKIH